MNSPRILKTLLRSWIAVTSLVSFALGWAMLAQTPRPAENSAPVSQHSGSNPAQSFVPIPTLDPSMLQLNVAPSHSPLVMPSLPQRGQIFTTGGS